MPELPEVTTTVKGLQKVLPGLRILDVWTDLAKKTLSRKHFTETLKSEAFYKKFKKEVVGAHIISVERRAKNILINLSPTPLGTKLRGASNKTILIHMKMTGHILYGKYQYHKKENSWLPAASQPAALSDPFNRFIHVVFSLSNGKHFVLCDSRKFATVTILPTDVVHDTAYFARIGPEPLERNFTFEKFKVRLLSRPKGNIKTVLMDQSVIAGIGNIYSDEMLWLAGIHPQSQPEKIPLQRLQLLYSSMKEVLHEGIDFGGDSTSDYRDINGARGHFQAHHNAYRKTGTHCGKRGCKGVILRKGINGRSAHFCSMHQKLWRA
jgi:formamidopyrimidine-DNA glycosylase